MTEGTIVERLQTQRTLLVEVVHQIEAAIQTFGGTISPSGNGTNPVKGSGNWISNASPQKLARWRRNLSKSQRAAKARKRQKQEQFIGAETL